MILHELECLIEDVQQCPDSQYDADTLKAAICDFGSHLRQHTGSEEKELFPLLTKRLGSSDVIKVIEEEHTQLNKAVMTVAAQPRESRPELLADILEYLKRHVSKEENVLFWLAEIKTKKH